MGQTGFCKNLRFPAVFCENLRFRDAVIPRKNENLQKFAKKNCEFSSVYSLSLLIPPDVRLLVGSH